MESLQVGQVRLHVEVEQAKGEPWLGLPVPGICLKRAQVQGVVLHLVVGVKVVVVVVMVRGTLVYMESSGARRLGMVPRLGMMSLTM